MLINALIGLVFGVILTWFSLLRGRRPQQLTPTPIAWQEAPVPIWRQDRFQLTFIALHSLSLATLAVMFLMSALSLSTIAQSWLRNITMVSIWFVSGSAISFPLLYPIAGTMPMFIFSNGVARGQYWDDWNCFSFFVLIQQHALFACMV